MYDLGNLLNGARILITGGTGSLGQQLVSTILADYHPRRLVIFSRDELKQELMRRCWPDDAESPIRYFIGDVRDVSRLRRAFDAIDYVIHAAALKQVPACEYNPTEAVKTNVLGALNVIEAALDCRVRKVLALSTDKCCQPVNLYGATKLVAEKLFIQANSYRGETGTRFSAVRYGNVVGSRGSVVPLWREQAQTGCITLTHAGMSRFWITLDQAAAFVLSSLSMLEGGEIFVPKLPSMMMVDAARAIAPDCEIREIGVRPGEKLSEALISREEGWSTVDIGDRFAILPQHPWWSGGNWANAKPFPPGMTYESSTNDWWLSAEELKEMIEDAG